MFLKTRLFIPLFLLIIHCTSAQVPKTYRLAPGLTEKDYLPGIVIVKFKENDTQGNGQRTRAPFSDTGFLPEHIKLIKAQKVFSELEVSAPPPSNRQKEKQVDLSGIYKLHLSDEADVITSINLLLQRDDVEYAEPYFKITPLLTPNDPGAHPETGNQDYLKVIKAYEGWDLSTGDPNLIIGVLDTGFKPDHEDLQKNLHYNLQDPLNNFDDDEDGFRDNFAGWDFGDNDNIPLADYSGHGTEVLGVISATENNGVGIAGIAQNSRFMAIKVFTSLDNSFSYGYEAIIYAANKGCKVLNLSWGSHSSYSRFVQDIINYVVLEKDVVVVAAAGNTNEQLDFYPASYNNVLSVGATDILDNKASWATYSYHIDVMAPGHSVYTTFNDGSYGFSQGSSFSAPMVAGAAALMRSKYPALNAQQIMEKIRVSADDIYNVGDNSLYRDKLGKGRLNIRRALEDHTSPSIRMIDFKYNNNFGIYAFYEDTVDISCTFKNFLSPSPNARITLSSSSPYVTVLHGVFEAGSMGSMEIKDNSTNPFKLFLHKNIPPGYKINLKLSIDDIDYSDHQIFQIETSPDYLNLENGSLTLTVSGNGKMGFHDDELTLGKGISLSNSLISDQLGYMIAFDQDKVYNTVINNFETKSRSKDFSTVSVIKLFDNGAATIEARSKFEDNASILPKINLQTDQKVLIWNDQPENEFFILEYRLFNKGESGLTDIFQGLYVDFNVNNRFNNKAFWDESLKLSYTFDPSKPDLYAGVALLSPHIAGSYILNKSGSITEDKLFSSAEKFTTLSSGTEFANSADGNGSDISTIVSGHIPLLKGQDFEKIAYVILTASSLDELKSKLNTAKSKYEEHLNNPPIASNILICAGESANIAPAYEGNYDFYSDINLQNRLFSGSAYNTPPIYNDTSFYFVKVENSYSEDVLQAKIKVNENFTNFSSTPEELILTEGGDNSVVFHDLSSNGVRWSWDFSNGYGSSVQNPKVQFTTSGIYKIKLITENNSGCESSLEREFRVLEKSADPLFSSMDFCEGEKVAFTASNSSLIHVYVSELDSPPIHIGSSFEIENISSDTVFYISNFEKDLESSKKPLSIHFYPHNASFSVIPDPEPTNKNIFILNNQSKNGLLFQWTINGNLYSVSESPVINFEDYRHLDIKLLSWSAEGCKDSAMATIEIKKSPPPIFEKPIYYCNDHLAIVSPDDPGIFFFYADENLETLVHKGSSFETADFDHLFVTSVENLMESDPVKVELINLDFHPDFRMQPETLNLSLSQEVSFFADGDESVVWEWDLGLGTTSSLKDPVHIYQEEGEFNIKLTATNREGCVETLSKILQVVNITDVQTDSEKEDKTILFPNPTSGPITIISDFSTDQKLEIVVSNFINQVILKKELFYQKDGIHLNMANLKEGYYAVTVKSQNILFTKKVVLQK